MEENTETTRHQLWAQSKLCYGADVYSFFGGDWSVLRKWGCAALRQGRGGWNGSRGCIRGRRIRLRVVDVWRNLGRISPDTRWNKVSYIMCQNQVLMLSVWTLLNKPPVGLELCVSDTVLTGSCGMGFFIYAAGTTQYLYGINNAVNWIKVN